MTPFRFNESAYAPIRANRTYMGILIEQGQWVKLCNFWVQVARPAVEAFLRGDYVETNINHLVDFNDMTIFPTSGKW